MINKDAGGDQATAEQQLEPRAGQEAVDPRSAAVNLKSDNRPIKTLSKPKKSFTARAGGGVKDKPAPARDGTRRSACDDRHSSAVQRILARAEIPQINLDSRHLPPSILEPLETGSLTKEHLAAGAMTLLTAIAAAAAPATICAATPELGPAVGIGIRLCLLAEHRDVPVTENPVIHAVHVLQNGLADEYQIKLATAAVAQRIAAERRALHTQAVKAACGLGLNPPPALLDITLQDVGSPPQIVVREGGPKAIVDAASGGTNILLLDERRMPAFSRAGCGDPATAALTNCAAIGHPLVVHEAKTGHVTLRNVVIATIGVQITAEFERLANSTTDELRAVAFVPASPPPPGGNAAAIADLLKCVYALTSAAPVTFSLSREALSILLEKGQCWCSNFEPALHPLSTYLRQLPDLARRLAIAIHLAAAGQSGNLTAEITPLDAKRAVALVDHLILPTAIKILGAVSTIGDAEADARHLIAVLRAETTAFSPALEKRDLQRAAQGTIRGARFRAALQLLEQLELVTAAEPPNGSRAEYVAGAAATYA